MFTRCYKFYVRPAIMSADWTEISEEDLHNAIYKEYKQATPVIREMLEGRMPVIHDNQYRIDIPE